MLVANPAAFRRELSGPKDVDLRRTFDAAEVNPILNHESVFPFITLPGFKSMDVTDLLAEKDNFGNPKNVCLMADRGCLLFCQIEPGIYEVHTNFIREDEHVGRGQYIKACAEQAARWMFMHTDCMVLQTKVPVFNKPARLMMKVLGWSFEFERKAIWPHEADMVDVRFMALRYDDWFRMTDDLVETGREFHRHLEDEFCRHEIDHKPHPDDPVHDKAVGACAEMIFGGQIPKAVVLYNRWARFAGYRTIDLIIGNSSDVLLLDIRDAVLQLDLPNQTFRALICRPQPQ